MPMKRNLGFTMVELVITLAVAAVLTVLSIPSFLEYVANSRMSSATTLLVSHLNAARSEAVTRGEPVTVCASVDESSCAARTGWESGWIVFTDSDGEPGVRDGDDRLLLAARPDIGGDLSLEAGDAYVRFGTLGEISLD